MCRVCVYAGSSLLQTLHGPHNPDRSVWVCVCEVLSLMPQVVLDIFALWLINYRPVGPRKEQTNGWNSSVSFPLWTPVRFKYLTHFQDVIRR